MITFFIYSVDTKQQQFETNEELKSFIDSFKQTVTSEAATTFLNHILGLRSPTNLLLATVTLSPLKQDGTRDCIATKTFASEEKALEFQEWYLSTGKTLLEEMHSGLGWTFFNHRIKYAPDDFIDIVQDQQLSELARARIESYILNQVN